MLISLILSWFLFETKGGFGLMYFVSLLSSSNYKYCGQLRRMTVTLAVVA
jgi:hypothetical protein